MINKKFTNLKLEIGDTSKYGEGVFAKEDIAKGEIIKILSGEIISLAECLKRINGGDEVNDDPLQIGSELYIDLDYLSHAFNHSCQPNAGLRKTSELFALKNILKGEEITYDYSTTVGPNIPASEWLMKCDCGSIKCRKLIGNILTIPKNDLENYKKLGALQEYITTEFLK